MGYIVETEGLFAFWVGLGGQEHIGGMQIILKTTMCIAVVVKVHRSST